MQRPYEFTVWPVCSVIFFFASGQWAHPQSTGLTNTEVQSALEEGWKKLKSFDETPATYDYVIEDKSEITGRPATQDSSKRKIFIGLGKRSSQTNLSIYCKGDKYSFTLLRDGPSDLWRMTTFHIHPDDALDQNVMRAPPMAMAIYPLSDCLRTPCADLLSQGRIQIRNIAIGDAGRMNLDVIVRVGDKERSEEEEGTMTVDPSRHWVIVDFSFAPRPAHRKGAKGSIHRELYPTAGNNGRPLCRKLVSSFHDPKLGDQALTAEYSNYKLEDPPDDIFRLSHYGLPEPIGMEVKRKTPTYVWLLIGAGSFAIVGLGLGYAARRWRASKNRTQAGSTRK